MDITVVAVVLFILLAIFTPVSMLLTSVILRRATVKNKVRDSPYESGEQSKGLRISIMNEYLHYFGMFIAFEIIVGIILVWAPIANIPNKVPYNSSIAVLGLLVLGFIFEIFLMLIARRSD